MLTTITREIDEELHHNSLTYPKDYHLDLLLNNLKFGPSLSPTFGTLTLYHFWIYHMRGLQSDLQLGEHDKWIPISKALTQTETHTTSLLRLIHEELPDGMAHLPSSFD